MNKKLFGTDGIRGRVGQSPISADFVLKLGFAAGSVLSDGKPASVVIGKDTRISGYMFESALEAGFSAAGVDIKLLGPMPTPAVAYLTRTLHASAGVVISASHNAHEDNGIKFFSSTGEKLSDETELAIEAALDREFSTVASSRLGKASRVADAAGRYIEYCKSRVSDDVDLKGLKIVVDCANGANYLVGPKVFAELGADVHPVAVQPDGLNINRQCGSTYPDYLARVVVEQQADLGIAFDGDGDRVMLVDNMGRVIDGDQILYILAMSWQVNGRLDGGVVGTLMTNYGLELALKQAGIPFERTSVGDRFVHQRLVEQNWKLGGETSGHILCLDRAGTGDAIISALQVLEVMVKTGKSLSELTQGMEKLPQVMINVPLNGSADLDREEIMSAREHMQARLNGSGRLVLRPSGTEPVVRVMVEHQRAEEAKSMADEMAAVIRTNCTEPGV